MPRNLNPLFTLLPWFLVPSVPGSSFADDWGQLATISSTMGVQANHLCLGEASRGDIGCPSYAPTIAPNGTLTATKFAGDGSALTNLTGGNLPTGAIMAFDLATCPTGWSEYTPAYGRFLRGIDKSGTGIDPAGTRTAGNVQADELRSHSHPFTDGAEWRVTSGIGGAYGLMNQGNFSGPSNRAGVVGATGGAETRPKNVAVLYCRRN